MFQSIPRFKCGVALQGIHKLHTVNSVYQTNIIITIISDKQISVTIQNLDFLIERERERENYD